MALNKITDGQLSTYGVIAAPDRLTGDANQNKLVFDRLIRSVVAVYFNALVDALTSASGAGEIGAAVDGIEESNVLGVLAALKALQDSANSSQGATNQNIQNALDNRYTKDQANALLNEKVDTTTANELVKSITFDSDSGVFTITTMGGVVTTIDTMIEKVPAGFSFEGNQLVLTLEDGTKQYADLSAFIDTYTFTDGGTIVFSQTGKDITAEVKDGSLALSKLQPEIKATLESYAVRAEDAQEKAAAAQTKAEAARDTAQGAATTATTKAGEAVSSATAAKNSATAAMNSEANAQKSENAAVKAQAKAEAALAGIGDSEAEAKKSEENARISEKAAGQAKTAAETAQIMAEMAKTAAEAAKDTAQAAATTATNKANEAGTSATEAENSAEAAETAQTKAEKAAELAKEYAGVHTGSEPPTEPEIDLWIDPTAEGDYSFDAIVEAVLDKILVAEEAVF